ncbi:DUF3644 domain-containing protein [Arabiibacter massiliensis]|uniref:DUF3644 domain-containing protein n=1 Tax=Arabiibacter massiliensis TaxID=1870985 RepID=UPI0009BB29D1|nr:DUF3644 domain-containing protein [Arabiibacter massiliensis]
MNDSEHKTSDRLIKKSREAFVLAVELYNRPSIRYRVEGCAFFLCNAWELMLKAKLIKDKGLPFIYYKDNPSRTKNLEQCIALVFTNAKDPLRRNLESIIRLRNTSTHFIVEEYEQVYAGLFQSCVTNFDEKLFEFHGVRISDDIPRNFLMLSMSANPTTPDIIRAKYSPEVAEKFLFDENEVIQEQIIQSNQRFCSVVRTELVVVKDPKKADFAIVPDPSASSSVRVAKVLQDPHNTHPLSVGKVVDHVNKRLSKDGICLMANGESKKFTTNDWKLFMNFYAIKENPAYAYRHVIGRSEHYTYSMRVVDFILNEISSNPCGVVDDLKRALKRRSEATPGAKEF